MQRTMGELVELERFLTPLPLLKGSISGNRHFPHTSPRCPPARYSLQPKSHFSANKLLLNILIGLLLEELSIILQVLSSILKGQACIIHIFLLKSEQRMSQKVAEPRPNFQKDFPDKKWLLVLSKCLWFPTAKFLSALHNLRSLDTRLVFCPSCLKYVHGNFPNTLWCH